MEELAASRHLGEITKHEPREINPFDDTINNSFDIAQGQAQTISSEQSRLKNVADATWLDINGNIGIGEKWTGFSNSWNDTWAAKGIDYFKHDRAFFRQEDEEFKKSFNDDAVFEFLNQNNLTLSDFNDIKGAVSLEHAMDLAEMKNNKTASDIQIQNSLTETEQLTSAIATSVVDVDVFIGGAGAAVAKGISRSAKASKIIAATTAGAEVGYGAFIAGIDDDVSLGEAMLLSTIIGGIDYAVIRRINATDRAKMAASVADAPKDNNVFAQGQRTAEAELNIAEGLSSPELRANKLSEVMEELSKPVPNKSKIARLEKEIEQLATRKTTKPKSATRIEADRIKTLKEQLTRRQKVANSIGFKQLQKRIDDMVNPKIKAIPLNDEELTLIHQQQRDILDLTEDLEMNINGIKADLKSLAKGDVDIAGEVLQVYKKLHSQGHVSDSFLAQVEYAYNKGAGKGYTTPKIEVVNKGMNKDMEIKVNGKKVGKVGFAIGTSLVATSAFAYDGQDLASDAPMIILAGILALAGVKGAVTIAKHGTGIGAISQMATAMKKTEGVRAKISKVMDETRTSLTETIRPLQNATTGKVRELVDNMYYDPINTQKTVERIKNRVYHAHWNTLQRDVSITFKQWLKETGTSKGENLLSLFGSQSKRYEYDKMITEHIEHGHHTDIPSVVSGAKEVNRIIDSMMSEMIEAGVKDVDKATILKNYVPRSVRRGNIATVLAHATPTSKAAFIREFAKMLTKSDLTPNPLGLQKQTMKTRASRQNVAEAYIEAMTNITSGAGRKTMSSLDDIKDITSKLGLGDDVAIEIAETLGVAGDSFGRLKNRIPMDKTQFKSVQIDYVDGSKSYTMDIEDMFEQDIMNVMAEYLNKSSGHVAFSDMGYKSIDEAIELVNKSDSTPKIKETILNDIEALSGSPVIDYSSTINKVMRDVGNLVMGTKMMFSTLSLSAEALTTAAKLNKSGWRGTLQNLHKNMIDTYGDDSFMMKSLTEEKGLGLGTHQYGASYGSYKSIDDVGNVAGGERGLSIMSKISEVSRDFALHTLPFVKTSDYLTKVNLQDSIQTLFNHASGKTKFKEYELESFAITPRVEELIKRFKLNSKGHVAYEDISKWSRNDRIDFYTTVDAMLQKRIQQSTMGTTGAYTRQTALGAVASVLIKFPMSAYSNIGSFLGRGMMAGDGQAMVQTSLWFGGGALATISRNEILGRDYDESDIITSAILSHPFAGAYGTAVGLMNPAPTKALADVQEVVNIYNYR